MHFVGLEKKMKIPFLHPYGVLTWDWQGSQKTLISLKLSNILAWNFLGTKTRTPQNFSEEIVSFLFFFFGHWWTKFMVCQMYSVGAFLPWDFGVFFFPQLFFIEYLHSADKFVTHHWNVFLSSNSLPEQKKQTKHIISRLYIVYSRLY